MLPALHHTGLLWLLLDLQLYSKLQLCNKLNTLSLLLWETVSVMFEHPWLLIFERKYAIYQCNRITCSSNSEIIGWKNSKESQNGTNVRINLKYLSSRLYVQNHTSVFHLSFIWKFWRQIIGRAQLACSQRNFECNIFPNWTSVSRPIVNYISSQLENVSLIFDHHAIFSLKQQWITSIMEGDMF